MYAGTRPFRKSRMRCPFFANVVTDVNDHPELRKLGRLKRKHAEPDPAPRAVDYSRPTPGTERRRQQREGKHDEPENHRWSRNRSWSTRMVISHGSKTQQRPEQLSLHEKSGIVVGRERDHAARAVDHHDTYREQGQDRNKEDPVVLSFMMDNRFEHRFSIKKSKSTTETQPALALGTRKRWPQAEAQRKAI